VRQPLVLDASAAVAVVRREPEGEAVGRVLLSWAADGVPILVPDHFWLEVVNSLVRRHRLRGADVMEALHVLDRLGLVRVELDRPQLLFALDLAERHGLTAYDAAYLATAVSTDASLLTLDRDLAIAAGDRAVPLDGGHRLHEAPATYEHEVTWPSYRGAAAFLAELRAEARAGRGLAAGRDV